MTRSFATVITTLILTLSLIPAASAALNEKGFDKLSAEILESFQSFYPVRATEQGIHSYDHRLADYSSKTVKRMTNDLSNFSKKLYKYRNFKFSPDKAIDFKLIRSNVERGLLDLKQIKWHRKSPQLYIDEATNGIYFLMLSQHAPVSEKLYSIIGRMKAVPGLFQTAQKNLKKPPEVYLDLAMESLETALRFYQQVAGELMRQFPERADEILRVSTAAREAMSEFSVFLSSVEAGPESSFAVGRENFDYLLEHEYFLNYDSDSLLKIGETLLAQAQEAYASYQTYVETSHQNGRDSVFVPASFQREDILDYYNWEIDQAKAFLAENELVSGLTDIAPLEIVETPAFLRSMIGGIAYQPAGPFDDKQTGIFYVRPIPEDLDRAQMAARYRYLHRRGFRGSVVHEGFPGHHLQMQLAGAHPSAVRKWQANPMMIEGWALYCEEMMYHAGYYGQEDPVHWLAILGGIRYRAARIVADVKLHTGQFTFAEGVEWMTTTLGAETESDKNYHRIMVRKYTLTPTVWMSYLIGKQEIERLRDDLKARDGASFSEREFYDQLLSQGSIPPALSRLALGLPPESTP